MSVVHNHDHENEIVPFAEANFRNAKRRFGIKTDDRRRHMYVVGKTGMGKTTLLENLVLADIVAGHGVGVVDPHGDFAEKILDFIPTNRINDVVYFNPADMEHPVGFNILEAVDEQHKHLVASGMMGVFKKIWPDVWSPRMEYILNNSILALLDFPGSTMLGINRLLVDKEYRRRVIAKIKDPLVKSFWVGEYASYAERFRTEAIAPIQNKVGQFLSSALIRNIVAQVKSTIDPRKIMDEGQILIMNLSKGRIGEDTSRLLGGLLITKIQLAAMERVDVLERDRRDFYLYVDEFQNFATESFANILSEARKYRLNLIVAHQYIEQLDEKVAAAVFGNIGTLMLFRVGGVDSEFLEKEFSPAFMAPDLVNLAKYDVYLKLMIDGVASSPFSATTIAPLGSPTDSRDKVIKVSRERYSQKRELIEEKVMRWTGMDEVGDEDDDGQEGAPPRKDRAPFPAQTQSRNFDDRLRPPARPMIIVQAPIKQDEFHRDATREAPSPLPTPRAEIPQTPIIVRNDVEKRMPSLAPLSKQPAREAREWIGGHDRFRREAVPIRGPARSYRDLPIRQDRDAPRPPQRHFHGSIDDQGLISKSELVTKSPTEQPVSLKELIERAPLEAKKKNELINSKTPPDDSDDNNFSGGGSLKPGEVVKLDS